MSVAGDEVGVSGAVDYVGVSFNRLPPLLKFRFQIISELSVQNDAWQAFLKKKNTCIGENIPNLDIGWRSLSRINGKHACSVDIGNSCFII